MIIHINDSAIVLNVTHQPCETDRGVYRDAGSEVADDQNKYCMESRPRCKRMNQSSGSKFASCLQPGFTIR